MQPACDFLFDDLALRVANAYQHGMPLCARPYQAMAQALGCSEAQLLGCLARLRDHGMLNRVGPVFDHRQAGASTLAALAVPPRDIDNVAARVSEYPEVNHNYLRTHRYNLWFVITAPSRARIDQVLVEIAAATGLVPLDLPMVQAYRVDLGFPLEAPA